MRQDMVQVMAGAHPAVFHEALLLVFIRPPLRKNVIYDGDRNRPDDSCDHCDDDCDQKLRSYTHDPVLLTVVNFRFTLSTVRPPGAGPTIDRASRVSYLITARAPAGGSDSVRGDFMNTYGGDQRRRPERPKSDHAKINFFTIGALRFHELSCAKIAENWSNASSWGGGRRKYSRARARL